MALLHVSETLCYNPQRNSFLPYLGLGKPLPLPVLWRQEREALGVLPLFPLERDKKFSFFFKNSLSVFKCLNHMKLEDKCSSCKTGLI